MKYLFILALLALVFFLWQAKRRADLNQEKTRKTPTRSTPAPAPMPTTDMVACAVCQVHLPRHEALLLEGASYCCEAHRQKGAST